MTSANEASLPYSRRPLPAVYDAAVEFHLLARQWLKEVGTPRTDVAPIHRATQRACVAIFLAAHGTTHQLRRAREAMLMCLGLLPILRAGGTLSDDFCRESERRIDQILAGLDQLAVTPPEEWASLPLSPPAAVETGHPVPTAGISKKMESIVKRAVQAVALHASVTTAGIATSETRANFLRKRRHHRRDKPPSVVRA